MLKLLAIIFMTIDHVGLFMLDNNVFMRIIGRLSLPIFVYMAVQGLKNTKNLSKYFLRLMVFAIISQPVYLLFNNKLNILFGLLCSIAFIKAIDVKKPVIGLIILPIMYLCEYGLYTLILAILFYGCSSKLKLIEGFVLLNVLYVLITKQWLQLYSILSLAFILDKRLYTKLKINKYVFYAYYPLHLLLLIILSKWI